MSNTIFFSVIIALPVIAAVAAYLIRRDGGNQSTITKIAGE